MENITDALKMGAAILIFVIALSVTIVSFTKARQASTSIMAKSGTIDGFYDNIDYSKYRIVGAEEVIINLYLYTKTNNTILFYKGDYEKSNKSLTNVKKVTLYSTECADNRKNPNKLSNLQRSLITVDSNSGPTATSREIYGIDINDEITRNEFWIQSNEKTKRFIDSIVYRESTEKYPYSKLAPSDNHNKIENKNIQINMYYDFDGHKTSLINLKGKFIERIGEYNYKNKVITSETTSYDSALTNYTVSSNVSSSEIAFSNGESIENDEGDKKKVIQYIYIGNGAD